MPVYSGPGMTEIWLDDLEIGPVVDAKPFQTTARDKDNPAKLAPPSTGTPRPQSNPVNVDLRHDTLLLNGKPIYLRTALDQSFNPKGIYTAPDDDFLKRDLILAKVCGLNGLRIHIKPDEPRRLYWADRIGLLILEDMPNTWRQTPKARAARRSLARVPRWARFCVWSRRSRSPTRSRLRWRRSVS